MPIRQQAISHLKCPPIHHPTTNSPPNYPPNCPPNCLPNEPAFTQQALGHLKRVPQMTLERERMKREVHYLREARLVLGD